MFYLFDLIHCDDGEIVLRGTIYTDKHESSWNCSKEENSCKYIFIHMVFINCYFKNSLLYDYQLVGQVT